MNNVFRQCLAPGLFRDVEKQKTVIPKASTLLGHDLFVACAIAGTIIMCGLKIRRRPSVSYLLGEIEDISVVCVQ